MVRIQMRGGVWKNSEDEILKAGVMKYGTHNWARVASLLPRKTAKQVKARWFEWLDPTIKKTEWSRDEDEKLLHLAKLMPNQWRTIAPIVGRTARMCLDRYEHLLDAAQGIVAGDRDDARKLRPGEIDPAPESKPARPDPVDMDEDEKEMLSEARARLANTKGKKAKRKAREKQLEQARRLAVLQKQRELKAAGIVQKRKRQKRQREIDYETEIPFARSAPTGFHATDEEAARGKQMSVESNRGGSFKRMRADEALGGTDYKARQRREEEEDRKRMQRMRAENLPKAMAEAAKASGEAVIAAVQRKPLNLPKPKVTDEEFGDVVRHNDDAAEAAMMVSSTAGEAAATDNLLVSYEGSSAPGNAGNDVRASSRSERMREDARTLLQLESAKAPLQDDDSDDEGNDEGPEAALPFAAKGRKETGAAKEAADGVMLRDAFGINEAGKRKRSRRERTSVSDALMALPQPENEVALELPNEGTLPDGDDDEEGKAGDGFVEDAEVKAQRLADERRRAAEEKAQLGSHALLRGLPRPLKIDAAALLEAAKALDTLPLRLAAKEAVAMVGDDGVKHPVPVKAKLRRSTPAPGIAAAAAPLEPLADEDIRRGRDAAQKEAETGTPPDDKAFAAAWERARKGLVKTADGILVDASMLSEGDVLEALRAEADANAAELAAAAKKAEKATAKAALKFGGYEARAREAEDVFFEAVATTDELQLQRSSFEELRRLEVAALPRRMSEARALYAEAADREAALQRRFELLERHRARLMGAAGGVGGN